MILLTSVLVPSILVPSEDQGGTDDHVMSISGISLIRADRLAEPCSGPSIMLRAVNVARTLSTAHLELRSIP